MWLHGLVLYSLPWLNATPLYGYTTPVYSSVDGHVGCLYILAFMGNTSMSMHMFLQTFFFFFLILWGIY